MTKILPCTCKNAWQDLKYGRGMRVFNQSGSPKKKENHRCTCCGIIIQHGG